MDDNKFEAELVAKGLTAPRITPADIEAAIAHEMYFTPADALRFAWITSDPDDAKERERRDSVIDSLPTRSYSGACIDIDANTYVPAPLTLITICVLITHNGHKVVGVNEGPVSAANFDPEMGRKLARQKAIQQLWVPLGYALRERLHQADQS